MGLVMSDRAQYRPMIRRALIIVGSFVLGLSSFGFLMLVVGAVPPGVVLGIGVSYVAVSVAVGVFGFRFGRRHGYNTDPDVTDKALGRFMASPWGFLAVVLSPAVGLAVAAKAGDVGRAALPLAMSAFVWFVAGAGVGNLWWIKDGESNEGTPGPNTDG